MKIYTKTGDKGNTYLYGGMRISKADIRIETYGTVDELNSYIGLIRDQKVCKVFKEELIQIQKDLFTIGAMLATPTVKKTLKKGQQRLNIHQIEASHILFLENLIDHINENLPQMSNFILPGGHTTASYIHIARCVCRRAERLCVNLNKKSSVSEFVIEYLNRLSDYLFVLARKLILVLNKEEILWMPDKI